MSLNLVGISLLIVDILYLKTLKGWWPSLWLLLQNVSCLILDISYKIVGISINYEKLKNIYKHFPLHR